jgi:hypothetical protein
MTQKLKHWQLWLISLTVIVLAIATGFIVFKPANKPTTEPSPTETMETESDSKNANQLNTQVENNQPKTFTSQKGVMITLENFNNTMSCPLIIKGSVSGVWFFEAGFTVQLVSDQGTVATFLARAIEDNWMTEQPVNFLAEYDCAQCPEDANLELRLQKSNPSGLLDFDDYVSLPISLKGCRQS